MHPCMLQRDKKLQFRDFLLIKEEGQSSRMKPCSLPGFSAKVEQKFWIAGFKGNDRY